MTVSSLAQHATPARSVKATPKPADTPTPKPDVESLIHFKFYPKAIFVIATANDDTRGRIVASLARRLASDEFIHGAQIVAEPNWTLANFVDQCASGADSIEGAFIVNLAATSPGQYNSWFFIRTYVEVAGNVLYAECTTATPQPGKAIEASTALGVPQYKWASAVQDQTYGKAQPNYLPTMSALFTAATAYVAFVPSKSKTSVETRAFPTSAPLPPGGAVTQIQTTVGSQSNPASQAGGVNSVTGALAGYVIASPNATPPPPTPELTWNAIDKLVQDLVSAIGCYDKVKKTSERRPLQGVGNVSPACQTTAPAEPEPRATPTPPGGPTHER